MSLLTLIKNVKAIGVRTANLAAVAGSADPNVLLLLQLANAEGKSLARRHPWTALTKEKVFTTVAAAEQPGALPTDFDRFIDETMFDRTMNRPVDGPLSAADWQNIQSSVTSRIEPAFRVRGTSILFSPTPPVGDTIAYEYISENWCASSAGAGQSAFAADADTALLDEDIMALGVEWRFRASKAFDYETALREYERQVADAMKRDGGQRTIDSSRRPGWYYFGAARRRTWPGRIVS